MIERTERLAKLQAFETKLLVGKRLVVKGEESRLALTHPQPERWHVNASYRTMADTDRHESDWDSRICDCDFSGQPHSHFRGDFTTYQEACEAFAEAEQAMHARQAVTLPAQWMPTWA